MMNSNAGKSLESWIWDAACSIRGAKDAAKYKEFILPLIFTKRLCDVFDDELDRIAKEVGSRAKAFKLVKADKKLVRFYLPLEPTNPDDSVWSVIRTLSDKIGEQLTTHLRSIADANPLLKGIIDRVDFNATTHGQRDIDDDRLSNLIEAISAKRLGLDDVEPDIIGRSYEYLIRKFAEGSGQSAGEFYTPAEVGLVMAKIMDPTPGMEIYDPCCGSAGLLIKCQLVLDEKQRAKKTKTASRVKLYGQENEPGTWAMANMNMIIHDLEGEIQIGDTFRNPKFRKANRLRTFDRVVANPMWNQTEFRERDYDADELDRFPKGAGYPGAKADWGWMQHILASLNQNGRAAVVLDTGAASRGSGKANSNKERDVRRWFVEQDVIEGVIYLPDNLFYNTPSPGIIIILNKTKPIERRGKLFLLNAARDFVKGDPKNYIPRDAVSRIAQTFANWTEVEKYSRIVSSEEIANNDFNISPTRFIDVGRSGNYRSLSEIVEELDALEEEITAIAAARKLVAHRLTDDDATDTMDLATLNLPDDWGVQPIREVFTFTKKPRGLTVPDDSSVPFLPMEAIPIGRVHVSIFEERPAATITSGTYVENGDLLVAKITPSFENGKQAILDWQRPFGYATTEVIPIKEINGVSNKHFLFHLLLHPEIRSDLAGKMDGTTGRQRLSKDVLGDRLIPVPPLAEQQKIAGVLELVQKEIELHRQFVSLTTELKEVLLHQLMTGRVRVNDIELPELPELTPS